MKVISFPELKPVKGTRHFIKAGFPRQSARAVVTTSLGRIMAALPWVRFVRGEFIPSVVCPDLLSGCVTLSRR